MTTKVFTAQLSDQMAEKIDQEEYYRLTMEALDDVDKGNVIDHKHIQDWAAKLRS